MREIRAKRRLSRPLPLPSSSPAGPTHENNYSSQINYGSIAKYVVVRK